MRLLFFTLFLAMAFGCIYEPHEQLDKSLPIVEYYYSSLCPACKEVRPLTEEIKSAFAGRMEFKEFDVQNASGMHAYEKFVAANNITEKYVPVIKIGNKTLTGLGEIKRESLYNALFEYLNISPNNFSSGFK